MPFAWATTCNRPSSRRSQAGLPATARRFLEKVQFLPMTGDQIATAFRRAFSMECPVDVSKLDRLTPGDFAVVARKAQVFEERDPTQLGKWLGEENLAKPEGRRPRFGF
jgi:transitional endoplasmic reticulum ATPase